MMAHNIIKSIALFAFIFTCSPEAFSQRWKKYRQEVMFGIGATNFLGELGGRNSVGRPFLVDFDAAATRPAVQAGYLYKFARHSKVRANLAWGVLRGDDQFTEEPFRNNRNLHFRSHLLEFSGKYEFMFNQDYYGNRYRIKGAKTRFYSFNTSFYGFVGLGGFYFNPQAFYNGSWVNLQPLGTEGQGLPDEPKKYSRFNIAIPIGGGVRYAFSERWRLGLELSHRITFTDYIDDVSTNYYDNDKLRKYRGDVAANIADPNKGQFPGQLNEDGKSRAGIQRGNPNNNDSYMFLMVNIYYILPNKAYRFKF
ncbi:MAG: outer membrane beta-barrel protein [Bacteroidetes bacterium]|nr:outer membrane beta-barrel protein [Bacteroidota bacterium]